MRDRPTSPAQGWATPVAPGVEQPITLGNVFQAMMSAVEQLSSIVSPIEIVWHVFHGRISSSQSAYGTYLSLDDGHHDESFQTVEQAMPMGLKLFSRISQKRLMDVYSKVMAMHIVPVDEASLTEVCKHENITKRTTNGWTLLIIS